MAKPKVKPLPPQPTLPPVPLDAPPKDNQTVLHADKTYTTVKEGLAYILIPPEAPRLLDPKTHKNEPAQSVFYNPIQQYNRDLTVLCIWAFGEDLLVRQSLTRKRGPKRKPAKKNHGKEAAEKANKTPVASVDGVEKVKEATEVSAEAPTKKRRAEDAVEAEVGQKRQKTATDPADFEDDGIDDDDLLAVESSMAPFSTAAEPKENGSKVNDKNDSSNGKPSDSSTSAPQPQKPPPDPRPQFRILDALSATGLRALRYAHELPFNTHVTANDLSPTAVEAINRNVLHNCLSHRIKTSVGNANAHMYSYVGQEGVGGPGNKYHVIDLDPYGTAVPFLDAAVQATADGGLLCVTCTDTGVFNSMGYAEKAFALYGGLPGKGEHCHEIGLRLILHAIASSAAKYGIAIEPLISLSIDYYARVFVRVRKSPADVKFLASKTMLVYACDHGCGAWTPQFLMRASEQEGKKGSTWWKHSVSQGPSSEKLCECCGSKMHVAGPMWGGALHNPTFVQRALDLIPRVEKGGIYGTLGRVEGMLNLALEEMLVQDATRLMGEVPKDTGKEHSSNGKTNGTSAPATAANDNPPAGAEPPEKTSEPAPETPDTEIITEQPPASPATKTTTESPNNTTSLDPTPSETNTYAPTLPSFTDLHPFYLIPSALSRVLHCQAPPDAAFRGALRHLGYRAVRSHAQPGSIKTNAPWDAIWDVMAAWIKEKPIREGALSRTSAGFGVLKRVEEREKIRKEAWEEAQKAKTSNSDVAMGEGGEEDGGARGVCSRNIVFDEELGREVPKARRLVRYQLNPRANWGPMAKAK
jgi:tRNA (guanine26-N2/guanine27-N2)-dimethyltransferase